MIGPGGHYLFALPLGRVWVADVRDLVWHFCHTARLSFATAESGQLPIDLSNFIDAAAAFVALQPRRAVGAGASGCRSAPRPSVNEARASRRGC